MTLIYLTNDKDPLHGQITQAPLNSLSIRPSLLSYFIPFFVGQY